MQRVRELWMDVLGLLAYVQWHGAFSIRLWWTVVVVAPGDGLE